jgi:3-hydroxyacyl-CoA dehydrogenase
MEDSLGNFGKVVILGANGTMGAASAALFAGAGVQTTLLARSRQKAADGAARIERLLRSNAANSLVSVGAYDVLEREVAAADLVLEAVAEDYGPKIELLSRCDDARRPGTLVASVSSGLSVRKLCERRSDDFVAHFMGIHLFNPPTVINGCELISHARSNVEAVRAVRRFLESVLRREVVETRDTPAFCGNRVGFKVLNQTAQWAEELGVHYLETVLGTHTGRSMGPFATIDFVGLDVHEAIADNLFQCTKDDANACFAVPSWLRKLTQQGRLGRKTPDAGGVYRVEGTGGDRQVFVYDIGRARYVPLAPDLHVPDVVAGVRRLQRIGRYSSAAKLLSTANGRDAELMRAMILGYISYALGLVGEVVESARDVDRIMGFGFNWAPPGLWVDYLKPSNTIRLLEQARLSVPRVVVDAARRNARLFDDPRVDGGRFFMA